MAQISVSMSEEEKQAFADYCKEHDIKVSQLVRWDVKEYIDKGNKEQNQE